MEGLNNKQPTETEPQIFHIPGDGVLEAVVKSERLEIDDAVNLLGHGAFQRRVMLAAGLCFAADATEVLLLSFLAKVLQPFWGLSDAQAATIFSSGLIGQILGTLTLGPLADRFGRRPIFLLASLLIGVFGFLTAAGSSYGLLIFFRTVVGVGIGCMAIPFDLLSEVTPIATRGRFLVSIELFWASGQLLVLLLAYFFLGSEGSLETNPNGWRIFVAAAALPTVVSTVLGFFWVPESPRWLLAKGRDDEALEILRKAAKINGKDPDEVFPAGTTLHEGKEQETSDPRELFRPTWRKVVLLIGLLWATSAFSYFGIIQLGTKAYSNNGPNADPTGYSFEYGPLAATTSSDYLGIFLAMFLIDRVGRVKLQAAGYAIGAIMILVFGITVSFGAPLAAQTVVNFFGRACYIGAGSTTWAATVELLPTGLRATGHSFAKLTGNLGGIIAPYIVESSLSMVVVSAIFAAVGLMCATVVTFLPETMGQALGEVVVHDGINQSSSTGETSDSLEKC